MVGLTQPVSFALQLRTGRELRAAPGARARTDPSANRPHEDVAKIWNELAAFDAAASDAALEYLLRATGRLIGADRSLWVGAVRMRHGAAMRGDAQRGWRGRAMHLLDASPAAQTMAVQARRAQDQPDIAMTSVAVAAAAGKFRAVRMRQLVDMAAFRRTAHHQKFYAAPGIDDRMWISFPVSADAESHFVFDRLRPHRRFTQRELELAASVLCGLRWFHRQLLLCRGLTIATGPLSPAQRQVLALLLTDRSEKAIAEKLGQSIHTTHTHVRDIFRRFGVSGRAGLMAIWLSGR